LAEYFLNKYSHALKGKETQRRFLMTKTIHAPICLFGWPGNIRELEKPGAQDGSFSANPQIALKGLSGLQCGEIKISTQQREATSLKNCLRAPLSEKRRSAKLILQALERTHLEPQACGSRIASQLQIIALQD